MNYCKKTLYVVAGILAVTAVDSDSFAGARQSRPIETPQSQVPDLNGLNLNDLPEGSCLRVSGGSAQESKSTVSLLFLEKRIEDFYQIPPPSSQDEQDFAASIDHKLNTYSSRMPGFNALANRDANKTVKSLLRSTALEGAPSFGPANSNINQNLRSMLIAIFKRLDEMPRPEDSNRFFKKLANGFLDCQQVQFRVVRELFLELSDRSSLKLRIAVLLDSLKKKWLHQVILQMEGRAGGNVLDTHLESAYLIALGDGFGISGLEVAQKDRLASNQVNSQQVRSLFSSFVNSNDIISTVHGDFTSTKDEQKHAELFNFVKLKNYNLAKIYDTDGLITKRAVEKILIDLEVIIPADSAHAEFSDLVYLPFPSVKPDPNEQETDFNWDEESSNGSNHDSDDLSEDLSSNSGDESDNEDSIKNETTIYLLLGNIPNMVLASVSLSANSVIPINFYIQYGTTHFNFPKLIGFEFYLNGIIERQINHFKNKGQLLKTSNDFLHLGESIQKEVDDFYTRCPLCLKKHDVITLNPVPCNSKVCEWQFAELGLGRDPIAELKYRPEVSDFLIAMTYAAAHGKLRDLNFDPFPEQFQSQTGARDFDLITSILSKFPSTKEMQRLGDDLRSTLNRIHPHAYYLLQWILNSNRSHLEYVPQGNEIFKTFPNATHILKFISNPPEKERSFDNRKKKLGSNLVYHGSNISNWHSIVRNSLMVLSRTARMTAGAAYGSGIYCGKDFMTSSHYSHSTLMTLRGQSLRLLTNYNNCMLVCEAVKSPKNKDIGSFWVVKNDLDIATRYILLF